GTDAATASSDATSPPGGTSAPDGTSAPISKGEGPQTKLRDGLPSGIAGLSAFAKRPTAKAGLFVSSVRAANLRGLGGVQRRISISHRPTKTGELSPTIKPPDHTRQPGDISPEELIAHGPLTTGDRPTTTPQTQLPGASDPARSPLDKPPPAKLAESE